MPISWNAHRTSTLPSAARRTVTLAIIRSAVWKAVATPMPTSHRPSRIERGSGVRSDQPNRSAPTANASRSIRCENRLPLRGSVSGSLRIRSSIGSMPSSWASSSIADSRTNVPIASPGARSQLFGSRSSSTTFCWVSRFAAP